MNSILRLKKIIRNTINNSTVYYIVLLAIFIAGTVVGSLVLKSLSSDISLKLIRVSSPYIDLELSRIELFKSSLMFNYLFILVTFLLGLLNLGFLSSVIIFMRGSLLGLTVGFFIQNYGIKGFFSATVGIYPQYVIFLPCIILAGGLSILFDTRTNLISRRKKNIVKINLSDYITFLILIVILISIGSLYEGFITPTFFRF